MHLSPTSKLGYLSFNKVRVTIELYNILSNLDMVAEIASFHDKQY